MSDRGDNSFASLDRLYHKGIELMHSAENKPRGSERSTLYAQSKKCFLQCVEQIESLSLFSTNESKDDISTNSLKYLLVPAYLCKIMTSTECGSDRLETFTQAKSYALKFLNLVYQYGFDEDDRIEKVFSDIDTHEEKAQKIVSLQDAMQTRDEKIKNFRARQLMDSRIEELERQIKKLNNGSDNDNPIGLDHEFYREYYLQLIQRWIDDILESLNNEIKIAILFEQNRARSESSDHDHDIETSTNVNKTRRTSPLKTLTIAKDDLQKRIFGLGYPSNPTVTVDEFITQKFKNGDLVFQKDKQIYSNSLQRYAEQPNLRRDQEEISDEEKEAKRDRDDQDELIRLRKWDEFKDETPRGSGNRQNMG